jgi:hypothetical protein
MGKEETEELIKLFVTRIKTAEKRNSNQPPYELKADRLSTG